MANYIVQGNKLDFEIKIIILIDRITNIQRASGFVILIGGRQIYNKQHSWTELIKSNENNPIENE